MAIENDVHVVGVSSQAAGHKTLVPELVDGAGRAGRRRTSPWSWAASSRRADYDFLREHGCRRVFGPGTPIPKAAREVLEVLRARRG